MSLNLNRWYSVHRWDCRRGLAAPSWSGGRLSVVQRWNHRYPMEHPTPNQNEWTRGLVSAERMEIKQRQQHTAERKSAMHKTAHHLIIQWSHKFLCLVSAHCVCLCVCVNDCCFVFLIHEFYMVPSSQLLPFAWILFELCSYAMGLQLPLPLQCYTDLCRGDYKTRNEHTNHYTRTQHASRTSAHAIYTTEKPDTKNKYNETNSKHRRSHTHRDLDTPMSSAVRAFHVTTSLVLGPQTKWKWTKTKRRKKNQNKSHTHQHQVYVRFGIVFRYISVDIRMG